MLRLAEAGLEAMKFFPAEASGGRPYLSAVAGPCPQLRFCPTGGITLARRRRLARAAQRRLCRRILADAEGRCGAGDWARIEALARKAAALRG